MTNFKITALGLATLALTGCAATEKAHQRIATETTQSENKFDGAQIKSSAAAVASGDVNKNANFVKSNRNWVNPTALAREDDKPDLPSIFQKNVRLTMPGTVSAVEVLSEVQRASGLKFAISQDVYNTSAGQARLIGGGAGAASGDNKTSPLTVSDFVFSGTLAEALNLLASKANVSWKWNGQSIEVFRFETKTYNIAALAGATSVNSSVALSGGTSGSSSSSSSGGSQANTGTSSNAVSRQATMTTWQEVTSFLVAQMSSAGSIAVLESTGVVTVTDTPSVHKRISKTIEDLNELMTKQIYFNVDVYSVSASSGDSAGLDWNLVWANGGRNSLGFQSTVGGSASSTNPFSVGILTGPFAGSSVVMNALSTVGRTTLVNQFALTTLNGRPVPIAANKKIGYLAEVKVTQPTSTNGAPTVELKPGEVMSGVNLSVTPKVEPSGNIVLEYVMNLSDVLDIRTFTSGSQRLEIPTSDLKTTSNMAVLRSGQTLVLSGFKQQKAKDDRSGVGHASNILLGGKNAASVEDQYLVIAITPHVAQSRSK